MPRIRQPLTELTNANAPHDTIARLRKCLAEIQQLLSELENHTRPARAEHMGPSDKDYSFHHKENL